MLSPDDMDGDSIGPDDALLAYSSTEPRGADGHEPALRIRPCRRGKEPGPGVGGTSLGPGGCVIRLRRLGRRALFMPPERGPREPPANVGVAGVCVVGKNGDIGDAHPVGVGVEELVLLWNDDAPSDSCSPFGLPRFRCRTGGSRCGDEAADDAELLGFEASVVKEGEGGEPRSSGDMERSLTPCIEDNNDDGASTDRSGEGGERMASQAASERADGLGVGLGL